MNRTITISLMDDELYYIKCLVASKDSLTQYDKNIINKLNMLLDKKRDC